MRTSDYVRIFVLTLLASSALALSGCAELQAVPRSAESVIDTVDDALRGMSAAYEALCGEGTGTQDRDFCSKAKDSLNVAIRSRNFLTGN